ncbi:MAG TPA: dienelactone hydrolase family protein [Aggregatilineales bacterium]|nr:dienelactone hydrolase family protein [Aggregatilineales bacterium]
MCYDDRARPPMPPGDSIPARGEDLVLTASDGNRFAAYAAFPTTPTNAQVIIYPDVRGLHQFYKELAMRFAEVGVTALAIDYFGRTAGLTSRAEPFEYMPHVQQLKLDSFMNDVQAAVNYLREKTGKDGKIFVVGFCMGGALTLVTGTKRDFGFAGLMPFYGVLTRSFGGSKTPIELVSQIAAPVLAQFGGADQAIPVEAVKDFDEKLDATGVEHQIIIYEGAPHSFFDKRFAEHAEASSQSWQRMLEFMKAHTN